jgi:hypothetical protein
MSREFSYSFNDLPLLVTGGFDAGLVNGSALVSYWPNGEWSLSQIYLDGWRRRSDRDIDNDVAAGKRWQPFEQKPVLLDRGTDLHRMIWDRLENEWRAKVQDAVNEQIERDREDAVNTLADMCREVA